MDLREFYRTGKFKPNHSTYGGEIFFSDFCTDFSGNSRNESFYASRIISDLRFDEMCRKNIEDRNRKVMKILFDTDFLSTNRFVLATMRKMIGQKYETLPNVYKVTRNIIIRDDITPSTPKCQEYYKISRTKFGDCPYSLERLIAQGDYAKALEITGEKEKPAVEWLQVLKQELQSLGIISEKDTNLGDFKPANLGETKDGKVVYFDW